MDSRIQKQENWAHEGHKGYVSLEIHVWYEYYSQYCTLHRRFLFRLLREAVHRLNDRKHLTWWNGPEVPNNTSPCPKTPQHLLCSSPIHLLCVPSLSFSLHLSSSPFLKRCAICPSSRPMQPFRSRTSLPVREPVLHTDPRGSLVTAINLVGNRPWNASEYNSPSHYIG